MCQHEQKYCPRCTQSFECKVGNIHLCQCSTIILSDEERAFVSNNFSDCLCAKCLAELKNEFHQLKNKHVTDAKYYR